MKCEINLTKTLSKTKKSNKSFFLIIILLFIIISCSGDDSDSDEPITTTETPEVIFKFEAGDYDISWDGSPFKTKLVKEDENTLTGRFCLNNSISNCNDTGPIIITRDENTITFKFSDIICRIVATDLPGEFNGNGAITEDNQYRFVVNGEDCSREYTNSIVTFIKI